MSKKGKPPLSSSPLIQRPPMKFLTFQDSTHTYVGITQDQNGEEVLLAKGVADLDPEDSFDPNVGILLATGRAFDSLARKHLKVANGLVKHADDMREDKAWKEYLKWEAELFDQEDICDDCLDTQSDAELYDLAQAIVDEGNVQFTETGFWCGKPGARIFVEVNNP